MTVSITNRQKAKKGNIRYALRIARIDIKEVKERSGEISGRDGKPYHYNTVLAAFDKDDKYWNEDLIHLAERMIKEKKEQQLANN